MSKKSVKSGVERQQQQQLQQGSSSSKAAAAVTARCGRAGTTSEPRCKEQVESTGDVLSGAEGEIRLGACRLPLHLKSGSKLPDLAEYV